MVREATKNNSLGHLLTLRAEVSLSGLDAMFQSMSS